MGNSPSSSSDSHHLARNGSRSSNPGAKFTMVYQDTPAIMYRPDTFQEAVDQARHTFQIPRYQPLEFSYQYLTVGYVTLGEHNWDAVLPTIHTLFITTQPLPVPSSRSSPRVPDSRRLSPVPFDPSQLSHFPTMRTQSAESSNVIPISPMDLRPEAEMIQPLAAVIPPPVTKEVTPPPAESPLPFIPLPVSSVEQANPMPPFPPVFPMRTPLGSKPLPIPPSRPGVASSQQQSLRPGSYIPPTSVLPNRTLAVSPPPLSPSPDPNKLSFFVCQSDASEAICTPEYRVFHLPRRSTIADLKDILADEYIIPAYTMELSVNGRLLEDDAEDQLLEAGGIGQGTVVVLRRA